MLFYIKLSNSRWNTFPPRMITVGFIKDYANNSEQQKVLFSDLYVFQKNLMHNSVTREGTNWGKDAQ